MTRLPVEVERCATGADAWRLMEKHHIHHIPVMSGSRLKGIVSQHDLLEARLRSPNLAQVALETICHTDVLTVSPVTGIDQVAARMLERQVGSAVVVDGGFVVGIFTNTDALRALRGMFRGEKPAGGSS